MAYGCNIGPQTMARLSNGVSYEDIQRITDWHLTEDNLKAALADIVNAIARLDTTHVWGKGKSSSSDGQRFLFPRKVLRRTYSHRLGDYALELYTFVADNYAPFYSVPIECTERDAAYVLDGLLYHSTTASPGASAGHQHNALAGAQVVFVGRGEVVQRVFRRNIGERALGLNVLIQVRRVEGLLVPDVLVEDDQRLLAGA